MKPSGQKDLTGGDTASETVIVGAAGPKYVRCTMCNCSAADTLA